MNRMVYVVLNPYMFDVAVMAFADERDAIRFFRTAFPQRASRIADFIQPVVYVNGTYAVHEVVGIDD